MALLHPSWSFIVVFIVTGVFIAVFIATEVLNITDFSLSTQPPLPPKSPLSPVASVTGSLATSVTPGPGAKH
jgi:hypothetical protein